MGDGKCSKGQNAQERQLDDCIVPDLDFVDDIALLENNPVAAQELLNNVLASARKTRLRINVKKTQVIFSQREPPEHLLRRGEIREEVNQFTYLGSVILSNGDSSSEITARICKATGTTANLRNL